jgi:hypothetical protein
MATIAFLQESPMRFVIAGLVSCFLLAALPAAAADPHEQERASEAERIQDELRARREAARDDHAYDHGRREAARDDDDAYDYRRRVVRRRPDLQVWLGLGTGLTRDWIETPCAASGAGNECSVLNTYTGNFTVVADNGLALRLRGVRASDSSHDPYAPYETAAMIGARIGRSGWHALFGPGVLHNVDNDFVQGDVTGLAWEVMFAPRTHGPIGLELGILGNAAEHADFVAFNIGVRFGALR